MVQALDGPASLASLIHSPVSGDKGRGGQEHAGVDPQTAASASLDRAWWKGRISSPFSDPGNQNLHLSTPGDSHARL